jgi:hypothetical protein
MMPTVWSLTTSTRSKGDREWRRQMGATRVGEAGSVAAVMSLAFRRVVDIPVETFVAALQDWERTGQQSDLHIGHSRIRGPIEHDPDSGTFRIEVRLARGRLRPPLPMRLEVDRWTWSPARTVLELIPCKLVRPTAAYFRAGHLLLDSLTHLLPQHAARSHAADLEIQRSGAADPALAVGLEPGSCRGPGR